MARVCDLIATVAPSDATILIQGETGTGKELVARAIHEQSRRRERPLVSVSCAAIPDTLLESELFGHEKGAFTGAIRERPGRFELAHGGTLFLDEVADLGPAVQAKLLRVLQEKAFERVGGVRTVKVDVRLISATRKRLEDEVVAGRMREDLFYRLKVITIRLPALRERREDILPLAEHFLEKYRRPLAKEVWGLAPEATRYLLAHPWPGNVRELEAAIQRAVTLTRRDMLSLEDLAPEDGAAPVAGEEAVPHLLNDAVREAERRYLLEVLQSVGGQRQRAAEILGISRKTLWKKLKTLGVE
jgi:DNA-binding NtrC family response regulator